MTNEDKRRRIVGSRARLVGFAGLALLAAIGCAKAADDADTGEAASTAEEGKGEWGPQVGLREKTTPTDADGTAMPSGGWYVSPIHASLLPDGKVFVTGWSRKAPSACTFPEGSRRNGVSFLLDPAEIVGAGKELVVRPMNENVSSLPGWRTVLYCAGHSPVIVNGQTGILLTGGSRYLNLGEPKLEIEEGIRSAHLAFENGINRVADGLKTGPICPSNDGQELLSGENAARGGKWYPTSTRMPDGTVLITGGFTGGPGSRCNPNGNRHSASAETFDPATGKFTALVQPEEMPGPMGEFFAPGDKDYTHTILLPEPIVRNNVPYQVAMMGYRGQIVLMNTDRGTPGAQRFYLPKNGNRPDGAAGWDSTMALVSTGELLVMGGTNDPNAATKIHLWDPRKADDPGAWTSVDSKIGRRNAGATLLPDGRVLIINGWRDDSPALGLDQRTHPIIFDPETRAISTYDGADGERERGYHSFTLLQKDGTILVGGGIFPSAATGNTPKESDIGCERTDVRTWTPPYLPRDAARPVVKVSDDKPIAMKIGGAAQSIPFEGAVLDAKKGAVLMALGSFTHGFDQNQRYVRLQQRVSGGQVELTPPANATVAPPGDYLLFFVSDKGVPSAGKHVRLTR